MPNRTPDQTPAMQYYVVEKTERGDESFSDNDFGIGPTVGDAEKGGSFESVRFVLEWVSKSMEEFFVGEALKLLMRC